MKMRKGLLFSVLLVAGLAFVGFSPQSYAAKQKKKLVNDCGGAVVGSVVLKKKGSDVLVKVKITKGVPNLLFEVYWTCTSGPCHESCGFVNIGTMRTDGSGKGKFKYQGPIPLSGKVHFDVLYSGVYYAGEFAAPDADLIEASEDVDVIEGDPTLQ
ncbi:MAG TPA: hypothetical protein VI727_01680 [Candidatus Brocadiaceae bacterium]|nr:hypothetical protein [Candidatus Brocadiaceae bacterium]